MKPTTTFFWEREKGLGVSMVVLSGEQIREHIRLGKIVIEPFDEKMIGPSQVDLRLGNKFRVFKKK